MKDQKAALGNSSKPDTTHVRRGLKVYVARACEYGSAKYERSNYLRTDGTTVRDGFRALRAYLRAAQDHIGATLDRMEDHQSRDPELQDVPGMMLACLAPDLSADVTGRVGPSMLPHVAHAGASLMMAIEKAIRMGVLPEDPGCPWEKAEASEKSDPQDDWAEVQTRNVRPPKKLSEVSPELSVDKCPHDTSLGLLCSSCAGGYARRSA